MGITDLKIEQCSCTISVYGLSSSSNDEKAFPPASYIKHHHRTSRYKRTPHTTTSHTPMVGYKDAENSNTTPNNSKLTTDETLSTTMKLSGPSTVDEPPRRGEAMHEKQWAPRRCLQEGNDTGVPPPPIQRIGFCRSTTTTREIPRRRLQEEKDVRTSPPRSRSPILPHGVHRIQQRGHPAPIPESPATSGKPSCAPMLCHGATPAIEPELVPESERKGKAHPEPEPAPIAARRPGRPRGCSHAIASHTTQSPRWTSATNPRRPPPPELAAVAVS